MSDPVLDLEAGEESSSPREYFDVIVGAVTYRLTSGTRDLLIGSTLYLATAISRADLSTMQVRSGGDNTIEVRVPVNHALVKRWLRGGVPPKTASLTAYRAYIPSMDTERFWSGPIVSMDFSEQGIAKLVVASQMGEPLRKRLPTITAGSQCSHVLYDSGCKIDRDGVNGDGYPYLCSTTVLAVSGRDIRVDLSTIPAGYTHRATWLALGEVIATSGDAIGDRMSIRDQNDPSPGVSTVTVVGMQLPMSGLKIGDTVTLMAGCAHDIAACNSKFSNKENYGGLPFMNPNNPYRAPQSGPRRS
jgi:hypothetical protein